MARGLSTLSAVLFIALSCPVRGQAQTFVKVGESCGINPAANSIRKLFGVHFLDLDGDGHLDFYAGQHANNPMKGRGKAFLNDGRGNFTPAPGFYPQTEIYNHCDINGDGKVDLAVRYLDGYTQWFVNTSALGNLNFTARPPIAVSQGRAQAIIDMNRDGKADWLLGHRPGIRIFPGTGTEAIFATRPSQTIDLGIKDQATPAVIPVDVDGDGDIDLLTEWGQYGKPNDKSLMINNGNMTFADVTAAAGLPTANFAVHGAADVDHDGDVDIIAFQNKSLVIYLNDGKGHFTLKPGAIDSPAGFHDVSWGEAVMTDLDNDGQGDLVVDASMALKVLRGTGGGNFKLMNREWGITNVAFKDAGNCFGDIDGDGDLDLAAYTEVWPKMTIDVYRNDLPAKNWVNVRLVGAGGNRVAAGSKIRVYTPGTTQLLWYEQVVINSSQQDQSYYDYGTTERHYGLNTRASVDVEVEFYPSGKKVKASSLAANKTWIINEDGTFKELTVPTENLIQR